MKLHNVEQQSDEWFALRVKYPLTGSKAQAIGSAGKGLETLCNDKMAEKYSSGEAERFSGKHTERGNELEDQAAAIYELKYGVETEKVGFITNSKISGVGGVSLDRNILNSKGIVEIKCHEDKIHFKKIGEFKKTGKFKVDSGYLWQMNMQMLFSEAEWCDMVAFNPNYPESLLVVRVEADPVMQQKIITGLKVGENLLKEIEANYNN
ncbi:MAG: YqaJ viral recombinase family protein [Candidatus Heimdallarchaeaceae archaeon]